MRRAIVLTAVAALALVTPAAAAEHVRVPTGQLITKPATAINKRAVTLDSSGVVGATQMQFRDAGGQWTGWLPFARVHTWTLPGGDGRKTVEAQYQGADGSLLPLSVQIFLDRRRPNTVGYALEAKRTTRIALTYKVVDRKPSCGLAKVTIRVYRYGKPFTTFKKVTVPTNRKQRTRTFKCSWSKGWYTYKILATDIAGNRYERAGVGVLFVK